MFKAILRVLAVLFLVVDPIGVLEMVLGEEKHEIVAKSWFGNVLAYEVPVWANVTIELRWLFFGIYGLILIYVLIGMFRNLPKAMEKVMKDTQHTLAIMVHSFTDANQKFETQSELNSNSIKLNSTVGVSMDVFGTEIPYTEELVRKFAEVTEPLRVSKKQHKENGYQISRGNRRKIVRFVRELKESMDQLTIADLDDEDSLKKHRFEFAMLTLASDIAIYTPDLHALWDRFSDESHIFSVQTLSNQQVEKKLLESPEVIVFSRVILSSLYLGGVVETMMFDTSRLNTNGVIYYAIVLEDNQFALAVFDSSLGHQPDKAEIIKSVKKTVRNAKGSTSIGRVFNK